MLDSDDGSLRMASITLGCNFSDEHVRTIIKLKEMSIKEGTPNTLARVYGSPLGANPFGSVRQGRREYSATLKQFSQSCDDLRACGIGVNLTLNSVLPHIKGERLEHNVFNSKDVRRTFVNFVSEILPHIDAVVVATPIIIDLLHDRLGTRMGAEDVGIGISAIANVNKLATFKWISRNWPLVKFVCPSLWRNRDFKWLQRANMIVPLEPLANEFCSIGGTDCEGLYRQACYLSQSIESKDWNPMTARCIEERRKNPHAWLMAKFILPQWIPTYEGYGIQSFKITGRTHPASYIKQVGEWYLCGKAEGNLLGLWGQLQATLSKSGQEEKHRKAVEECDLQVSEVVPLIKGFLGCNSELCGYWCVSCRSMYKNIKRGD
jgi:collagenase-like PrtC family protease